MRRFPNVRGSPKLRNAGQPIAMKKFDSEVGWKHLNARREKQPLGLHPVDGVASKIALDVLEMSELSPDRPRRKLSNVKESSERHGSRRPSNGRRRSSNVGPRRRRNRKPMMENRVFNPLVSPLNEVVPVFGRDGKVQMLRGPGRVPAFIALEYLHLL